MKAMVYWNLHKKLWSIKALEGEHKGRVIAHSDAFTLTDCVFKVSEAGRQRVLRERKKNVHAGVVGTLASLGPSPTDGGTAITYSPYRGPTFRRADTDEPVARAAWVCGTGWHREVLAGVA